MVLSIYTEIICMTFVQPPTNLPIIRHVCSSKLAVVRLQAGKGSATLSMAYAAAKFAESCLRALQGEPGVIECAYVSSHLTDLPYFASPLRLDQNGVAVCLCPAVSAMFFCTAAKQLLAMCKVWLLTLS